MSHILPDQDLDLSFLYEIADGATDFIIESIDMFLEHTPQLLETISTGIADRDWVTVTSAAHKLKPNLGFFGMPVSQANVQDVELMAKEGAPDVDAITAKFNEIYDAVSLNLVSLKKIKAEKEAELS